MQLNIDFKIKNSFKTKQEQLGKEQNGTDGGEANTGILTNKFPSFDELSRVQSPPFMGMFDDPQSDRNPSLRHAITALRPAGAIRPALRHQLHPRLGA